MQKQKQGEHASFPKLFVGNSEFRQSREKCDSLEPVYIKKPAFEQGEQTV
jgi:hypothetical protein